MRNELIVGALALALAAGITVAKPAKLGSSFTDAQIENFVTNNVSLVQGKYKYVPKTAVDSTYSYQIDELTGPDGEKYVVTIWRTDPDGKVYKRIFTNGSEPINRGWTLYVQHLPLQ